MVERGVLENITCNISYESQTSHPQHVNSYAMLSRCLRYFEKKKQTNQVKLTWLISNGTAAPHFKETFDSDLVDELSLELWRQVFSSQETIKSLMHWIHFNILISDSPPEPIEKPYVSVLVLERISFKSLVDIYTQVHHERCPENIL